MPMPKRDNSSVTIRLSNKMLQAIELFSEQVHLSKSVIVQLALSKYLEEKDEFRNNPKARELLKDTDFFSRVDK